MCTYSCMHISPFPYWNQLCFKRKNIFPWREVELLSQTTGRADKGLKTQGGETARSVSIGEGYWLFIRAYAPHKGPVSGLFMWRRIQRWITPGRPGVGVGSIQSNDDGDGVGRQRGGYHTYGEREDAGITNRGSFSPTPLSLEIVLDLIPSWAWSDKGWIGNRLREREGGG